MTGDSADGQFPVFDAGRHPSETGSLRCFFASAQELPRQSCAIFGPSLDQSHIHGQRAKHAGLRHCFQNASRDVEIQPVSHVVQRNRRGNRQVSGQQDALQSFPVAASERTSSAIHEPIAVRVAV